MELHIVGWTPGLKKVSLTHLLSDDFGLSILEAKAVVDSILSRSDFGIGVSGVEGTPVAIHLTEPVTVDVLKGDDPSDMRKKLERLGLVIETP